ncbi:hypothetical protein [Raoultibacter massiliensis]|uniref:hypothetical protein n=1 Tax=Raoultibacter massiliensis TaxID=1852371 RepID=UPI000C829AAB|nr:hypothetical protein [Raoultibacter massiliensis]
METNESIVTKGVVSIGDRKQIGTVKGVVIDCDTCGVSHYIVSSASTNSSLVLPFEKSVAVGDTFLTIQTRDDFLSTTDPAARTLACEGYDLVGVTMYSRAGNQLGTIRGFEFDTTFGMVTKIDLGDGATFDKEAFVFFAPEFVFVDDGTKTDSDLRAAAPSDAEGEPAAEKEPREPEAVEVVEEVGETEEAKAEPISAEPEAAPKAEPVVDQPEETDSDAELKAFLLGKVLNERVVSTDGDFVIEAGEKITEKVLDDAQKSDALLLLTMSVDE